MPPIINIPNIPTQEIRCISPRKVIIKEFFAESDGRQKIFTEEDGNKVLGKQQILDPSEVSYMNLFINGVLQPKINYEVIEGKIILKTDDAPLFGSPIILQMIKF